MIYHNIEEVLTDDNLWRRMALKRTRCKVQADELVHRFYIEYTKVKELKPAKEINQGYVYRALRNLWIKEIAYQNRLSNSFCEGDFYNSQNITEEFQYYDEEYDATTDELEQARIDFLLKELDKIDLFHRYVYKYVVMWKIRSN